MKPQKWKVKIWYKGVPNPVVDSYLADGTKEVIIDLNLVSDTIEKYEVYRVED